IPKDQRFDATIIVTTNIEREFYSQQKANSLVQSSSNKEDKHCPRFAAVDLIEKKVVTNPTQRKQILEWKQASSSDDKMSPCLPAAFCWDASHPSETQPIHRLENYQRRELFKTYFRIETPVDYNV